MNPFIKLSSLVGLIFIITGIVTLRYAFKPQNQNLDVVKKATNPEIFGIDGEMVIVSNVIDGDTFEISDGRKVRLVGVDTPETVDPRRAVGCFGKEASNETKNLLTGKSVILEKDVSEKDKYERLLRLVYLPLEDGNILFVNDYLIRQGFAKVYTYPPDTKNDIRFKKAQEQAKNNNLGMWKACKLVTLDIFFY